MPNTISAGNWPNWWYLAKWNGSATTKVDGRQVITKVGYNI